MSFELTRRLLSLEREGTRLEALDAQPIAARYMTDAGQSITGSTWTIVDFDTADFDALSLVTPGASWKFTAPIGGYYQINAFVEMEAASVIQGGKLFYMAIYVDGVSKSYIAAWHQPTTGNNADVYLNGSDLIYLAKDSYLDIRVWHDLSSAATLATDEKETHVSVHLIDRSL